MSSFTVQTVPAWGGKNFSAELKGAVVSPYCLYFCVHVRIFLPPRLGVLVAVSAGSDAFQNNILAPLRSAYLYEESKQSFRYKSAFLIKNPELEEKVSPDLITHVPAFKCH